MNELQSMSSPLLAQANRRRPACSRLSNYLMTEMQGSVSSYDRGRRNDDNIHFGGAFRTDKVNPSIIKTEMKFHDNMLEWGQRLLYGHNVFTKYAHSHYVEKLQQLTGVDYDVAFCALVDFDGSVQKAEEALKSTEYLQQIREVTDVFDVDALIDTWQHADHEAVTHGRRSSSSDDSAGE